MIDHSRHSSFLRQITRVFKKWDWAAENARGVEVPHPAIRCLATSCKHRDTPSVLHLREKVIYLPERFLERGPRMNIQSCEESVSASLPDNWLSARPQGFRKTARPGETVSWSRRNIREVVRPHGNLSWKVRWNISPVASGGCFGDSVPIPRLTLRDGSGMKSCGLISAGFCCIEYVCIVACNLCYAADRKRLCHFNHGNPFEEEEEIRGKSLRPKYKCRDILCNYSMSGVHRSSGTKADRKLWTGIED